MIGCAPSDMQLLVILKHWDRLRAQHELLEAAMQEILSEPAACDERAKAIARRALDKAATIWVGEAKQ